MTFVNKRILFIIIWILVHIHLFPQERINLNGNWKFTLAQTEQEAEQLSQFYTEKFNSTNFKQIPVPSNWAILGFEEPAYRGFKNDIASEGFYLYDFKVPENWKEKCIKIHFGGIWSSAEIWINGKFIGTHHGGFTSFSFIVDDSIKFGNTNRLAIRVKQVNRDYQFDVYDDWTLGGIYRDVTLEALPKKRWIDAVVVKTDFDKLYQNADLKIKIMVGDRNKETLPGNYPSPGEPYNLKISLFTKEGKEIGNQEITIAAHTATNRETSILMHVLNPLHWTAETPNLYKLKVELIEQNKITQTTTEQIGFREISTEGGIFRINGQAVKLRGINRHDEHPDVGRATTKKHWLEDIKLMKAANINYIRMAHYTPAQGFIELCDELGMYVGEEVSIGGGGDLMYDSSFSPEVLQRTYETISRDINRSSIIYWSIGNEDALTSLHLASIKLTKALDPTRPVLLPWRAEEWLPEEVDILAPHYWKPQEYDQLAAKATRPIITTEYTHAFGTDGFGGLESRWKALTKHPSGAGAAIWMWADQGIKTPVLRPKDKSSKLNEDDPYLRIDEAGWDGIVDSYRNPTRDYWEAKAVYAQVYPNITKIAFTPNETHLNIPIQNDYDFTNLNSVRINWIIKEDEQEIDSGFGTIEGQPHTTSIFRLPINQLKAINPEKTYYAWFIFTNADGEEITRKAVELCPRIKQTITTPIVDKIAIKNNENISIKVGDIDYTFNPKTGQLLSASLQKKTLLTNLRPIIWRKLDRSEQMVIGKKQTENTPNYNQYTTSVLNWNIEKKDETVNINTTVNYLIDSNNQFTTTYRYTIGTDGKIDINYQILTKFTVPGLPIIGMSVDIAPELNNLKWLGLGPYNAYPNKQSAPILGVWGGLTNDKVTFGTKATRRIELSSKSHKVRIYNLGYLEHDSTKPETISILSGVLGRPEKGRKADDSIPQLLTNTTDPFVGEFRIELLKIQ